MPNATKRPRLTKLRALLVTAVARYLRRAHLQEIREGKVRCRTGLRQCEPTHTPPQAVFYEEVAPEPARHPDAGLGWPQYGRSTQVSVPRGGTVLEGAQRVRPDLPLACKGGVCGTCRARLITGEVRMRRNFALAQSELDAGFVLTCQSVTDTLTVDYDA
jgi:ferredoxin